MKLFLSKIKFLRYLLIPVLKKFNYQLRWKHDITKRFFFLELFNHKGYWYYGKNREKEEIDFYNKLIKKGDCVLEVGTHIGYLTQVFENLVGKEGKVLAVEPTPKSLFFLKKNTLSKTTIIEKAASNYKGQDDFFVENFGGFTNSLNSNFTKLQNKSHEYSTFTSSSINAIKVQVDTLDNICKQNNFNPNFIKIDVEGSEYIVLKGSINVLAKANSIMIEINKDYNEIINLLSEFDYKQINKNSSNNNYFFSKN